MDFCSFPSIGCVVTKGKAMKMKRYEEIEPSNRTTFRMLYYNAGRTLTQIEMILNTRYFIRINLFCHRYSPLINTLKTLDSPREYPDSSHQNCRYTTGRECCVGCSYNQASGGFCVPYPVRQFPKCPQCCYRPLLKYNHNTHNLADECGGNNVLQTAHALISRFLAYHDECRHDTSHYSFRLRQNQFQTAWTNLVPQPSA